MGTGFLVGERHVVTVSHNCYNKKNLDYPNAEEVYFIPDAHGKDFKEGRIKAAEVYCSEGYAKADRKDENERRRNDYAVLVLEEKVKREQYLRIAPSEWSQLGKAMDVMICGFPSDKMENAPNKPTRFFLYEDKKEAKTDYCEGLMEYEIFTIGAMSGSPLLARDENGEHFVVGLHWGRMADTTEKTGGCLLNKKAAFQIEQWLSLPLPPEKSQP